MKIVVVCVAISVLGFGASLAQPGAESSSEDEVRAAIEAFGEAYASANVAALDGMLTDDYVHVNGGSGKVLDRETWLNWIESQQKALADGTLVVQTYQVEDVFVRVHGNAAVATGVVHSSGIRNEAPFTSDIRFTNVWVQTDGKWRRAAFHDSALP